MGRLGRFDLVVTENAVPDVTEWSEAHGITLEIAAKRGGAWAD